MMYDRISFGGYLKMSKQAVEQMMAAAANDVALQQKLEAAGGFPAAVKIGAENGYDFTEAEAKAVLAEHGILSEPGAEGELSDQALEAVAGGWFDNWRIRIRW
jgi:predicted ribosomally synthesized peptide with nif11-like leader